ncbi:MAG: hypothetical protein ACOCQY_01690 [Halorhabdus sp.]
MASESTDPQDVAVSLPRELIEWLEEYATALEVDRHTLLEQLVASYRQTAEHDVQLRSRPEGTPADGDELEATVEAALDRRQQDIVAAVIEAIDTDEDLEARVETVERDFQTKLEDVRDRVVQVKREVDGKAPADHDHEAFERMDTIEQRLATLSAEIATLEAEADTHAAASALETVRNGFASLRETVDAREERLADIEEKLRTVGWAVSDLREEMANQSTDTLDRIKDAAARHDVSRAVCENCGEGVEIALLQRPACPHCSSAVTDVEPATGFFSKPSLIAASQIEAGEEHSSDGDVTATRDRDNQ